MCTYHAEFQIDRGMNYEAAVKVLEQEVMSCAPSSSKGLELPPLQLIYAFLGWYTGEDMLFMEQSSKGHCFRAMATATA